MREIRERVRLGPSTGSIVEEAVSRYSWIRLGTNSLVQLGYGSIKCVFKPPQCKTSSIAVDIACNKELTKKMLDMASIPVASGSICVNEDDLAETIKKLATNRVKTIGWKSRKGASINVKIGKMRFLVWLLPKNTANASL
jgi:cyanophycin synthetase